MQPSGNIKTTNQAQDQSGKSTIWSQFIPLVSVFFFWGFVAASNDILIPVFKKWFVLSQVQSQLVAWAFYVAYFVGSIIFFLISLKKDILQSLGYKKTLAIGLGISALGAFLFIPAASAGSFPFFLSALFIVGLGFSVQQIVANPLAIKMGSPQTGAHRLTLAGGINSLGTALGPILIGIALFGTGNNDHVTDTNLNKIETLKLDLNNIKADLNQNLAELNQVKGISADELSQTTTKITQHIAAIDTELETLSTPGLTDDDAIKFENQLKYLKNGNKEIGELSGASQIKYPLPFVKEKLSMVKKPFIILGLAILAVAVFLMFSKIQDPEKEEVVAEASGSKFNPLHHPQLLLGMLAIFIYVGVEVSIVSNLPALLHTKEFGGILEHNIAPFVSLYWGSLMIGRWNGSLNVFNFSKSTINLLRIVVPFVAFGIIYLANLISGNDVSSFYIYAIWIALFIVMSFIGGENSGKTLMLFGLAGMVMIFLGLVYPDKILAKYFFISGGLFCSIMWPAIFDIAIRGLGKHTGKGSSFLIMMILGGGVIPLIQGYICDFDLIKPSGIMGISWTNFSYVIPILCFAYIAWYGWYTPNYLRRKGIYDQVEE